MSHSIIICLALSLAAAGPKPKTRTVLDPSTPADAGDRAILARAGPGDCYAAIDRASWEQLARQMAQQDEHRGVFDLTREWSAAEREIDRMIDREKVREIVGGPKVHVEAVHPEKKNHDPAKFDRPLGDAAEVTILSGPLSGKVVWVRRRDLVRLVERPITKRGRKGR